MLRFRTVSLFKKASKAKRCCCRSEAQLDTLGPQYHAHVRATTFGQRRELAPPGCASLANLRWTSAPDWLTFTKLSRLLKCLAQQTGDALPVHVCYRASDLRRAFEGDKGASVGDAKRLE